MDRKITAYHICLTSLMIAIVYVTTRMIQIPIPLGYMHIGNVTILIVSVYFGPKTGMLSAGIGSALADITSPFAIWTIPTLIIKSFMGYLIGKLAYRHGKTVKVRTIPVIVASFTGILWMIIGYTVAGAIIFGSMAAGIAQMPGLTLEGIIAVSTFYAIGNVLDAVKLNRYLVRKAE